MSKKTKLSSNWLCGSVYWFLPEPTYLKQNHGVSIVETDNL